jgi:hypothetical protein
MSTTFDAPAVTGPRRVWWLIPELVALAVLAVLAVPYLGASGGQSGLHAQAAERGARLLEQASPAQHHDHGHTVTGEDTILCGIDVFGVDPPSATIVDEVQTVYGYYFCAVGRSGVTYLDSSRSDGCIVVHLQAAASIQIAQHGQGYPDRVRAMMPDQYEQYCFNGLPDGSVAGDVKRRYERQVQV